MGKVSESNKTIKEKGWAKNKEVGRDNQCYSKLSLGHKGQNSNRSIP